MTDTPIVFDIENAMVELSEEQAAKVWKDQSRRASNYSAYLAKMNATAIGGRFEIAMPKGVDAIKLAREVRYNINEAARERTAMKPVTLTEDEAAQSAADKRITAFDRTDGTHILRVKNGGWVTQVKEPVVIRWRQDTHEETREVVDKDGKKGKAKVNVPDKLYVLIVATTAVRKRAKKTADAAVTPAEPTANGETKEPATASTGAPF